MTNARALIYSCKSCRPLLELLQKSGGTYTSVAALAKASPLDRSTVDEHWKVLLEANVVRPTPISLNPDESTWDVSMLLSHRRPRVPTASRSKETANDGVAIARASVAMALEEMTF